MQASRLMVVASDRAWTLAAVHAACTLARSKAVSVLLLTMVPVRHPLMLGTEAGLIDYSEEDARLVFDMAATAEDYGVPLDVEIFQYAGYWSGVVDAAEQFRAQAVLARIPPSHLPYWQDFRRRRLQRQLARRRQILLSLDDCRATDALEPSPPFQLDLSHAHK